MLVILFTIIYKCYIGEREIEECDQLTWDAVFQLFPFINVALCACLFLSSWLIQAILGWTQLVFPSLRLQLACNAKKKKGRVWGL